MTTPYNTGKVKIGGAYVPRMKPEHSHGMTGPHKRPFFDREDRIVMWTCIGSLIALAIILSGCEARVHVDSKPDERSKIVQVGSGYQDLKRWGPDEHGVTCYSIGVPTLFSSPTVSCVKVLDK